MPVLFTLLLLGPVGPQTDGSQPLIVASAAVRHAAGLTTVAPPPPVEPGLGASTGIPSIPPSADRGALPRPSDEPAPLYESPIAEGWTPGCTAECAADNWLGTESEWCPLSGNGCPSCLSADEDKLHSTYDLYPHFAYYPEHHGHYYFRPYNWSDIAGHQCFAMSIGLDPRMPYSLTGFDRIYAGFPERYPPERSPIGTALPVGSGLPELESLLVKPDAP